MNLRTKGLALALCSAAPGCAQMDSHSTFTIEPSGAAPVVIGKNPGKIIESALDIGWLQAGNSLELSLVEARLCRRVVHEPVVRVERVDNKIAGGALYWEYGIAAAALAVGLVGLISPGLYSPDTVRGDGSIGKDDATGYRVGGIFAALGAGVLAIAVYDTVRSRDTEYRTEAFQVSLGDEVACATPELAMDGAEVTISLGDWSATGVTSKKGVVTFRLPAAAGATPDTGVPDTDPAPIPAPDAPPPPPRSLEVSVRVAGHRTTKLDVVVPYAADEAVARSGTLRATRTSGLGRAGNTSGS